MRMMMDDPVWCVSSRWKWRWGKKRWEGWERHWKAGAQSKWKGNQKRGGVVGPGGGHRHRTKQVYFLFPAFFSYCPLNFPSTVKETNRSFLMRLKKTNIKSAILKKKLKNDEFEGKPIATLRRKWWKWTGTFGCNRQKNKKNTALTAVEG